MKKLLINNESITNISLIMLIVVSVARLFLFGLNAYILLVLEFALILVTAITTYQFNNMWIIILCGINILSLFFTYALSNNGIGAILNYLSVLLALTTFNNHCVTHKTFTVLHGFTAFLLFIFIFTSNIHKADSILFNQVYITTFFGRYINANVFAMIILATYYHAICFVYAFFENRLAKAMLTIAVSGICIKYIITSECRSCLFAIAIFIFLLLFKKHKFTYTTIRLCTTLALFLGLIFTIWYYLNTNITDFQFLGKSFFSGRETVWANAWDLYLNSPIFGNGTDTQLAINRFLSTESAHNTMLSLLYVLGVIPTLTFVDQLTKKFNQESNYNKIAQFAFLSSLIITFFESFYADSYLFVIFLTLLIGEKENKNEELSNT